MSASNIFVHTESSLLPILDELIAREPIFHRAEFASDHDGFVRMTAHDYWEVGASGRRYSREFILRDLASRAPLDAAAAGWQTLEPQCRRLGQDVYLLTYTLHQGERRTRRATIWQHNAKGWQILYHQGTVIAVGEDDTAPSQLS